jgi:hypothetical protein
MKTEKQPVQIPEQSTFEAGQSGLLRRGLALSLAYLMIPMGMGDLYAQSYGQQAPPPPDQQYNQPYNQPYSQGQPYGPQSYYQPLSPDQLDQLVAPVALYPDALVAQVLAAATYPTQVVDADRWMQQYANYPPQQLAEMANGMPWDPSVKSLTAFPSVLDNLARNMDWTTQLGNAYYNQPQDVMEAVQAMRQQSYESGYLRSTPQMEVSYSPSYIQILPANPDVVYVPYYNPWNVYGPVVHPWYSYYAPPPRGVYVSGIALAFGIGITVGAFTHWGWGWGHWHPDWRNREVYYRHDRWISRSESVYNRGHFGDYDRHYARTDFHRDNNGHARGFDHQPQFHGRQNPNFGPAQQYRRVQNEPQRNFNQHGPFQSRPQQNFHNLQPQNGARPAQNFNHWQQTQSHPQQNFRSSPPQQDRFQRNFNRPQPQNGARPAQNFNRPQQFQRRPQQNFNRPQQNFNHPQQNFNRPQQNYHRPQPQQQNRPAPYHGRPNNHPQGHPEGHGNGHGNDHGHGRG